ncbi:MAG: ABC transporter ATP-binding protein [Bacteroidales bacterium]|nr:ABC transporter ATP-binding protein [Bacteroidales bacterium]
MIIAELQQVSKYYHISGSIPEHLILDHISLTIKEKEFIAITGPSGSGKSTLLNILGTLDQPTSGTVKIKGMDPAQLHVNALAALRNQTIGFVFQLHYLLPQLTLLQNVLLPLLPVKDLSRRKKSEDKASYLVERVGLKEHLNKLPSQLSVGECQRASLVRALINEPDLLLADEPTGSLDAGNAELVAGLLVELQQEQGFSMVIVTHSNELAQIAGKIYTLNSGKLIINPE